MTFDVCRWTSFPFRAVFLINGRYTLPPSERMVFHSFYDRLLHLLQLLTNAVLLSPHSLSLTLLNDLSLSLMHTHTHTHTHTNQHLLTCLLKGNLLIINHISMTSGIAIRGKVIRMISSILISPQRTSLATQIWLLPFIKRVRNVRMGFSTDDKLRGTHSTPWCPSQCKDIDLAFAL